MFLKTKLNPDNPLLIFEVQDTGVGVPEEIRDQLFEPFFQVTIQPPVGLVAQVLDWPSVVKSLKPWVVRLNFVPLLHQVPYFVLISL